MENSLKVGVHNPPTPPPAIPDWAGPAVAAKVVQNLNRVCVGASVRLWSEAAVAQDLGVDLRSAQSLLDALGTPRLILPGAESKYVNLYALESALFAMSLPTTMRQTPDGTQDPELIRLHQELAGAVYMASQKEAIRTRVKKLAQAMNRTLTPRKKRPIIKKT